MCSWLGKMQTVKELLVDNAERSRPGLDALAYAYIYLQVIASPSDQQHAAVSTDQSLNSYPMLM